MKKPEIKEESISKIKIEINTLFYMPGETIKGIIKLSPEMKIKISSNKLHLKLKLIQYEFWDYINNQTDDMKNIYKTEVSTNIIEYEYKEEEQPNFKENEEFGNFSIILIEKEDKDKNISIPFEFRLDENNNKLLPTFQFKTDKYILGIRHLLVVNCIEYNSVNHIGLFIGKLQNKDLCQPKTINNTLKTYFDDADIKIDLPKQSFYFGENINLKVNTKLKYSFEGDISLNQIIYRKIQWKGYLKNSLISKNVCVDQVKTCSKERKRETKFGYEDDELVCFGDMLEKFCNFMISGIVGGSVGAISGTILGGIICPHLLLGMFLGGSSSLFLGTLAGLEYYDISTTYSPGNKLIKGNFDSNCSNENKNIDKEEIKEELKKFVYFKNNKIIGFIKFKNDITPPVDGYYFKCDYNLKLDIKLTGCLSYYNNNILKTKIDLYDGNEYIENMKKKLNIDSLL